MPRNTDVGPLPPTLLFIRYTNEFEKVDWSLGMASSFDVSKAVDAMLTEGGAKGLAVVIQASLVNPAELFGEPEQPADEETTKETENA